MQNSVLHPLREGLRRKTQKRWEKNARRLLRLVDQMLAAERLQEKRQAG